MLLLWALLTANAQTPPEAPPAAEPPPADGPTDDEKAAARKRIGLADGFGEIIAIDTTQTDVYAFPVDACDAVRGFFRDPRPMDVKRPEKIVITIQNLTGATCLYRGVVLQGFLEGTYVTSQRAPQGAGFFLPAHGEVSVRIKPFHPELPRPAIELQIPPGRGFVLLRGLTLDEAAKLPVEGDER